MTYRITAFNQNGKKVCTWEASAKTIPAQMVGDSLKRVINGYAIDGVGIATVERNASDKLTGFRVLIDGEFVTLQPTRSAVNDWIASVTS